MALTQEQIHQAVESSSSMGEAASKCDVHYVTFKKYAIQFDLWNPNQSGKGISKNKTEGRGKFALEDILNGKYPHYSSHKLRLRLVEANLKNNICECCGIIDWNGKAISMHLDHIDGNHYNHTLSNLRILCPNCHSQTDTYGSKKLKIKTRM